MPSLRRAAMCSFERRRAESFCVLGTYRGTMTFTGGGVNAVPIQASTTVTHTGTTVSLSDLDVTSPFSGSFGLGNTTLNGNSFDGTSSYASGGCGVVTSRFVGHFAGNLMKPHGHAHAPCGVRDLRGPRHPRRALEVGPGPSLSRPRTHPSSQGSRAGASFRRASTRSRMEWTLGHSFEGSGAKTEAASAGSSTQSPRRISAAS